MKNRSKIIYTLTDEAPALATKSFLPIVQGFTKHAGIEIEVKDISLAARVLSHFSSDLTDEQKVDDSLAELGELAKNPSANIIKLPNISASVPQLVAVINELQENGFKIPDFPSDPVSDEEKKIRSKYSKILGSAVNPVLREGNSDRRVAHAVKEFAKAHPHSMGKWSVDSKSHVASMTENDFFGSEKSVIMPQEDNIKIQFTSSSGETVLLKESTPLLAGEVIDSSVMSSSSLCDFYEKQMGEAKEQGLLLSLHLKATMMKVSDPVMFGHAVKVYFKDVFKKYAELFAELGVNPSNGLGDLYAKIETLPEPKKKEIEKAIIETYKTRPELAMVNSDKGITNLHVPSDIIIDASMPAAIRASGKMWGLDGKLHDTKAMIPDRCYAGIYQETIDFCKKHGAFDPRTMGNVANVGLMAKKAEEYGSHDKTFIMNDSGVVEVKSQSGQVLMEHKVNKGDIFRMCQTKEESIKDWVKLGVARARATGSPAVFWLDEARAHDENLISRVTVYLKDHDTKGLEILILPPEEAIRFTLARVKEGQDTISVSGNVLRDYLTDLFPILELGTSAKMLSIVPLLAGGGLFETGAGGSAPKHVQQFLEEGHLRWDSLGEFLALAVSLEDLGHKNKNNKAIILSRCLNSANEKFLKNNKSPSRKVNELDNRGSHFYLGMYWAEALAEQGEDAELKEFFSKLYSELLSHQDEILSELLAAQGRKVEIGGYYFMDDELVSKSMRPSGIFNRLINSM